MQPYLMVKPKRGGSESPPELTPSQIADWFLNCHTKAAASRNHLMSIVASVNVEWVASVKMNGVKRF